MHIVFCSSVEEIIEQVNEQAIQPAVTETAKGKQKSRATKKKDVEKNKGKTPKPRKKKSTVQVIDEGIVQEAVPASVEEMQTAAQETPNAAIQELLALTNMFDQTTQTDQLPGIEHFIESFGH